MEMDIDMERRFWNAIGPRHEDSPHPAGNRASRRAALKAKRTAARQRSRKNESRNAVASVRHVGSVEEVAVMVSAFGRSLDGVSKVSFSPDASAR